MANRSDATTGGSRGGINVGLPTGPYFGDEAAPICLANHPRENRGAAALFEFAFVFAISHDDDFHEERHGRPIPGENKRPRKSLERRS